jgi:hypothetical protein
LTQPKEEIDWEAAINEAHGVLNENQAQTQTEQASEGTAPSPQILYTNQQEGAVNNLVESQGVSESLQGVTTDSNPVAELIETLPYCQSISDFAAVIAEYSPETVEDAIAVQDSQHRRSELQRMWEIVTDVRFLQSVTDWNQVTIPQNRLDEAWQLLDATEQNRLHLICEAAQQLVQRQWGITRAQAEMGGAFEWIRGGLVRIAYAAADFVKLASGEFVGYRELRMPI